jgi:hypothetical protein
MNMQTYNLFFSFFYQMGSNLLYLDNKHFYVGKC